MAWGDINYAALDTVRKANKHSTFWSSIVLDIFDSRVNNELEAGHCLIQTICVIFQDKVFLVTQYWNFFPNILRRETVPVLTSDNRSRSILVLAHLFVPPKRVNWGFGVSQHPLRYSRG